MFKLLDRMLLQRFFINLFIAVISWIVIFVIMNIIENLSKFIDNGATLSQFFLYYLYFIPFVIKITLPIAVLLTALFTINSFAQNDEIIAEMTAGLSLYRILKPILVTALFISILSSLFDEFVVPASNQKRMALYDYEVTHKTRPSEKSRSNIFVQDSTNRKFVIKYYNGKSKKARGVSIQTFDNSRLISRIDATSMKWQNNYWLLHNGRVRLFVNQDETFYTFKDSIFSSTKLKPSDLMVIQKRPEEMSLRELNYFIKNQRTIGSDVKKWLVERHLKFSVPFINFIVVLLIAPFAARKKRSGIGLSFGISLLVSFLYFIIIRFGQVLGYQGTLNPVLAAWMGNIIFLTIGLISFYKLQK
jgi:lipopolysaccharide export system permease protein